MRALTFAKKMVLLKPYYFYKPDSYWPRNGPFPTNYTILQMIRARAVKKVRVHSAAGDPPPWCKFNGDESSPKKFSRV